MGGTLSLFPKLLGNVRVVFPRRLIETVFGLSPGSTKMDIDLIFTLLAHKKSLEFRPTLNSGCYLLRLEINK